MSCASSRASGASRTCDVAEHLGGAAARAAGDDRAEALVREHADEHLDARRRAIRWTRKSSAGVPGGLERVRDLLRRAPDRGRPGQTEPHRAGLRLVHDAGRDALERDRPAELGGGLRGRGDRATTRRCSTSAMP